MHATSLPMDLNQYKAGAFTDEFGYTSFHPTPLNKEWIVNRPELLTLLEEANLRLGELNAFALLVPELDMFINMHLVKEATQSSRIENNSTLIREALLDEKDIAVGKLGDWQKVQEYIESTHYIISCLTKLPLTNRLLREGHKMLLHSESDKINNPGEFRNSQTRIDGTSPEDSGFVPPHPSVVPELMDDLEKFLNNKDIHVPHLIRIGMAHYQFEAIHPFQEGNGRMGRMMITLYLISQKVLTKPTLCISDFIEKNQIYYFRNLRAVSEKNSMIHWLKFFLTGVIETANQSIETLIKILALKEKLERKTILTLGKRIPNAISLLNYLYVKPVVTASDVIGELKVTKQTANNLIRDFEKLKILNEQTGFKRNRIFVFEEYIELFG